MSRQCWVFRRMASAQVLRLWAQFSPWVLWIQADKQCSHYLLLVSAACAGASALWEVVGGSNIILNQRLHRREHASPTSDRNWMVVISPLRHQQDALVSGKGMCLKHLLPQLVWFPLLMGLIHWFFCHMAECILGKAGRFSPLGFLSPCCLPQNGLDSPGDVSGVQIIWVSALCEVRFPPREFRQLDAKNYRCGYHLWRRRELDYIVRINVPFSSLRLFRLHFDISCDSQIKNQMSIFQNTFTLWTLLVYSWL